jgi:hypothetical protein
MKKDEILRKIVENHGYNVVPMHWEDGIISYGIFKNEEPVIHINNLLKKEIESNVPNFSHFGMGDVVHLYNNFSKQAVKPMLKQFIRKSSILVNCFWPENNRWIPTRYNTWIYKDGKVYKECQRAAKLGVMVALPLNIKNPLTIGWSVLHPLEKKDNIDWNYGTELAIARASDWHPNELLTIEMIDKLLQINQNAKIGRLDGPQWMWSQIFDFAGKAKKYYNVNYAQIAYYHNNKLFYLNS